MLIEAALYGVLLPGIVTAAVLVVLVRPWRSEPSAIGPAVLGPAIALGLITGYCGLVGAPELSPLDIVNWLPHLALLAAVACAVESRVAAPVGRWAVRGAAAVLAAWLIVRPLSPHTYGTGALIGVVIASAAVLVAYWHVFALAARDEHRLVGAGLAILVVATMAAAVAASGTALIGQLIGAGAAALGAVLASLLLFARTPRIEHAAGIVAMMTWAGGMLGFFYASMRIDVMIMLAAMPAAFHAVRVAATGRVSGRVAVAAALAVAVLLGAGAVGRAVTADAADDSSTSDYDYGYGYQ